MNHPRRAAWHTSMCNAKNRKIEFNITFEEYCELVEGTGYIDNKGRHRECLHLDRIDATKGYYVGNIQVITMEENVAKGNRERHTEYYKSQRRLREAEGVDRQSGEDSREDGDRGDTVESGYEGNEPSYEPPQGGDPF